jgi:hypothetical protein
MIIGEYERQMLIALESSRVTENDRAALASTVVQELVSPGSSPLAEATSGQCAYYYAAPGYSASPPSYDTVLVSFS